MRLARNITVVVALATAVLLLAACSGDDGPDATATPLPGSPTSQVSVVAEATPTSAAAPTSGAGVTPTQAPSEGIFIEPRQTVPDRTASLGEPKPWQLEPWDRQTVTLFDLQQGASTSYGPGFFAGFSSDDRYFGYNADGMLHIVEIATSEQRSFPSPGGLSTLVGEHYAISPAADGSLLDFLTGQRTSVSEIADPQLRYAVEQRLRPNGGAVLDGLVLERADWNDPSCAETTEAGRARCSAEAFEQWTLRELATGREVMAFRAIAASPAGPGEIVIATSPQCAKPDGSTAWCEDVLAEWRPTLDRGSNLPQYAEGTTNIFLLDVATGDATFIATAAYRPHAFIGPANWPLIANEHYVVWTEAYCGVPAGKTRILDRPSGEITELDVSAWVRWHGDKLGLGAFSSYAIVDPATREFVAAVPQELSGVAWTSDFRYAAVGMVLGHGGLCG